MTLTRILTTASFVALIGGTAAYAGDERPKDVVGNTPADSMAVNPAPMDETMPMTAPDATSAAMPASTIAPDQAPGTITTRLVTNGPVADTEENRALYAPLSRAGKMTKPKGN